MKDDKRDRLYARYLKMFEPMYDISVCRAEEIDDVIDYIDTYWKRGHALVKSKELMDWQHYNPAAGTYNFVIARSKETGEIHAIEGFIPTSQFDPEITAPMTWGAIWKTRDDVAPAGLGVVVKQFREHECPSAYAMEVGISADAAKYNKRLGNTIFDLQPWYMANKEINDYKIFVPAAGRSGEQTGDVADSVDNAQKADPSPAETAETRGVSDARNTAALSAENGNAANTEKMTSASQEPAAYRQASAGDWESLRGAFAPEAIPPYKSHTYYYNRYFAHPLYTYEALLLEDAASGAAEAIFYRVVRAEGRRAVFIVDYIGDGSLLARAQKALTALLAEKDAEYILFLCSGVPESALLAAGFADRRKDSAVVPVYYEPFLCSNVDILCTSHGELLPWPVFKGDADQDRPNVLP